MKLYTAKEAASIIGVTYHAIEYYSRRYGIGKKYGRFWLYTKEDVETIENAGYSKRRNNG